MDLADRVADEEDNVKRARIATRQAAALLAAGLLFALLPAMASAKQGQGDKRSRGAEVRVMTRNLYLGADLAPGIAAPNREAFIEANGKILRDVTANDFPVRARGLAEEILKKKPDLVGLQEAALWRTGPPSLEPLLNSGAKPTATAVRYDYLKELLARLNKGGKRYRVAVVQDEFDFEAPANENGQPGDGPNGVIKDAEINGRLTMRDAILVRAGVGATFKHKRMGHFSNLLVEKVSGVSVTVTRGWVAIDAKVRGSHAFRFVD